MMSPRLVSTLLLGTLLGASPVVYGQAVRCEMILVGVSPFIPGETSVEEAAWIRQQRQRLNEELRRSPNYQPIKAHLKEVYNKPNVMDMAARGDLKFIIQDTGLLDKEGKQQPVLVQVEGKDGQKRTLLSSLDLKKNNTMMPVGIIPSPTGKFVFVKVAPNGTLDAFDGVLIETATGRILQRFTGEHQIDAGNPVWLHDQIFRFESAGMQSKTFQATIETASGQVAVKEESGGFIQSSADQAWIYYVNRNGKTSVRSTLNPQAAFEIPARDVRQVIAVTADGAWVRLRGKEGNGSIIYLPFQPVTGVADRLLRRPPSTPARPEVVIAESDRVIEGAQIVDGRLAISSFRGADRSIHLYDVGSRTAFHEIKMPDCCQLFVDGINTLDGVLKVRLSSPAVRLQEWRYHMREGRWEIKVGERDEWRAAEPHSEMMVADSVRYVTRYESVRSADGTMIPVRITYRADLAVDGGLPKAGEHPTYVNVYGGFGLNSYFHPEYNGMLRDFMKRGGIHIAPATRGSTFFGQRWHDDGRALKKQNVLNDVIATLEWAIAAGFTKGDKIILTGDSHGGLVSAAVGVMRPDLVGLVVPRFGPLNFAEKKALDPRTVVGQAREYGDLISNPEAIANARRISPLENIIARVYPRFLIMTGMMDSRVNPLHSTSFAAKLRQAQQGPQPIDLLMLKNAGHWMTSEDYQGAIGWMSTTMFWTVIYDHMGLRWSER